MIIYDSAFKAAYDREIASRIASIKVSHECVSFALSLCKNDQTTIGQVRTALKSYIDEMGEEPETVRDVHNALNSAGIDTI